MSSVLEEKDAIRELMARYCFRFDNGEFDAWLDLFTDDGTFDLGARGQFNRARRAAQVPCDRPTHRWPAADEAFRCQPDHFGARDTASAQSYVLVVSSGATVTVTRAGRYEDQLAKQTGLWRFRQRTVRFDLMAPT